MVTATQVPGTRPVWCSTNSPVGSVTAAMPVGAEVEAADLVDRAEAVLHRPDHPEARVAVALEVQHHVDEVLEHPRPGDRAVLGDVADDHGGDVAGLGHADQRGRDLLDLGDAAGHAVDAGRADGLDGVDDEQGRSDLLDVGEHGAEVGLRGEVELGLHATGAVGAQPHLGGRLLAGDVERAALVARGLRGDLQQQRALADTGLAGEQDRCARAPARRRAPGRARGRRCCGRRTPPPRPRRSAPPGWSPGRPRPGPSRPRPRRPTPTPGTPRTGRPTCRSPSRTRRTGRRIAVAGATYEAWSAR